MADNAELLKEMIEYLATEQKRLERVLAWINGTPIKTDEDLRTVLRVAKQILKGEAISPNAYRIGKADA
jgi:hypothetical protein